MADDRLSKNQRREEARLAAQRIKDAQARKARRQRNLAIVLAVVGALLVGGVAWAIISQENRPVLADVELRPGGSTLSGAIPVGQAGIVGVTEGAAEDAVTVAVYSDFICPYCAMFEALNGETLTELRESGDVVVEYHLVSIMDRASEGTRYSTRAVTAVALVADEDPAAFVDFVGILFANQPAEGTTALSDAEIADFAEEARVSDEVTEKIRSGAYLGTGPDDPGTFQPWVVAATEQASKDLGGLATPTILLNGERLDTTEFDWTKEGQLVAAIEDARG